MTRATTLDVESPTASSTRALLSPTGHADRWRRVLAWYLRFSGGVDVLAVVAVLLPTSAMAAIHEALGLGELPSATIVGYLARSTSLMYALHGAMVIFVSFDVVRYRPLIAFLVGAALLHGLELLVIYMATAMPLWWTLAEGPVYCLLAAATLVLLYLSRDAHLGKPA